MSMEQKITMIVAASENNVIGLNGGLPWHIPEDMKRFKELTMGKPVVMGRRTYFSIPEKFRPLEGRRNIIMSRLMKKEPGFYVAKNIDQASMFMGGKNSFIIGGEEIYKAFYPYINEIELTRVHGEFRGDAFLPEIDWNEWNQVKKEMGKADYGFLYAFETYQRKSF